MSVPLRVQPDLISLFAEFPPAADLPRFELIPANAVPEPYHTLLVHKHHMTVTVEAHHGDLVNVKVLARNLRGSTYARKIVLTMQKTGRVVLFGIPRINLACCSEAVREAILEEKTPLGRILIQHKVLRRIEPTAFLRIDPGPKQLAWFGLTEPRPMYGRLAYIYYDGKRAVELLEIVRPEE
jgi:chorismate-pyruvate lyase